MSSPHPLAPPARAGVRCGAGVQGFSERLCENPEFANRVPTSTPRAWGAHADRPDFLLPSMPFIGAGAPQARVFTQSGEVLASRLSLITGLTYILNPIPIIVLPDEVSN